MYSILKGWRSVFWEWVILLHLVEKAQEQFDEEQAKKLERKIRKNQFDFADFKQQLEQIKENGKPERPDGNDTGSWKTNKGS